MSKSNDYFTTRENCPVCESEQGRVLYACLFDQEPIRGYLESFYGAQGQVEMECLVGAEYRLKECLDCGLLYQAEVGNDALLEKLYEEWISPPKALQAFQESANFSLHAYYAQEVAQYVAYLGKMPAETHVLDFGMGWGRWALMAKAFGCQTYGSELSQSRLDFASQNGIELVSWDAIPTMSFDFINTEQVFEHLPDPLGTLRYLARSLKPGGLIKISVPNTGGVLRALRHPDWLANKGSRNSLNPVAPLEHLNCYSRSSLIQMARLAGMREVKMPVFNQYRTGMNVSLRRLIRNIVYPPAQNLFSVNNRLFFANEVAG